MKDVPGLVLGQLDELPEAQVRVPRRRPAPGVVPAVDLGEKEAQGGSLQLVEARVVADELEGLLVS